MIEKNGLNETPEEEAVPSPEELLERQRQKIQEARDAKLATERENQIKTENEAKANEQYGEIRKIIQELEGLYVDPKFGTALEERKQPLEEHINEAISQLKATEQEIDKLLNDQNYRQALELIDEAQSEEIEIDKDLLKYRDQIDSTIKTYREHLATVNRVIEDCKEISASDSEMLAEHRANTDRQGALQNRHQELVGSNPELAKILEDDDKAIDVKVGQIYETAFHLSKDRSHMHTPERSQILKQVIKSFLQEEMDQRGITHNPDRNERYRDFYALCTDIIAGLNDSQENDFKRESEWNEIKDPKTLSQRTTGFALATFLGIKYNLDVDNLRTSELVERQIFGRPEKVIQEIDGKENVKRHTKTINIVMAHRSLPKEYTDLAIGYNMDSLTNSLKRYNMIRGWAPENEPYIPEGVSDDQKRKVVERFKQDQEKVFQAYEKWYEKVTSENNTEKERIEKQIESEKAKLAEITEISRNITAMPKPNDLERNIRALETAISEIKMDIRRLERSGNGLLGLGRRKREQDIDNKNQAIESYTADIEDYKKRISEYNEMSKKLNDRDYLPKGNEVSMLESRLAEVNEKMTIRVRTHNTIVAAREQEQPVD